MIAVPNLWGNIFIGRSKEGFYVNKVMVGYDGWTMVAFIQRTLRHTQLVIDNRDSAGKH
jgi:hypothetical protein